MKRSAVVKRNGELRRILFRPFGCRGVESTLCQKSFARIVLQSLNAGAADQLINRQAPGTLVPNFLLNCTSGKRGSSSPASPLETKEWPSGGSTGSLLDGSLLRRLRSLRTSPRNQHSKRCT